MKTLSIDRALDEHLKPVKDSDGTSLPIEIASDSLRVSTAIEGVTPIASNHLATKEYVDDNAGGGGSDITVQEEGSSLSTAATTLNFVGDGITASGTGATKTITVPNIITSGTATPSSVADKTPNNGDIYIEINEAEGDGTADTTGLSGNENPFRIYVRDSDSRLLVLEPYTATSTTLRLKEKYNTGPVPVVPTCTNIYFCTSGGTTINSTYYQTGSSHDLYCKVTYNSDVDGALDSGTAKIKFTDDEGTAYETIQYKDLDTGTNNTRTSSACSLFENMITDRRIEIHFLPNSASEDGITVINGASDKYIYARNDRIWGEFSGAISAAKILHDATGANNQVSSSTNYKSFGTKTFDVTQGNHIYFGIPDGASPISSVLVNGGTVNQIGAFTEVDLTYENASEFEETYTIWYTADAQGAATGASFEVS